MRLYGRGGLRRLSLHEVSQLEYPSPLLLSSIYRLQVLNSKWQLLKADPFLEWPHLEKVEITNVTQELFHHFCNRAPGLKELSLRGELYSTKAQIEEKWGFKYPKQLKLLEIGRSQSLRKLKLVEGNYSTGKLIVLENGSGD